MKNYPYPNFMNFGRQPNKNPAQFNFISQEAARQMQNAQTPLIDLRSPTEYKRWHLPGAISLPLSNLTTQIRSIAPTPQQTVLLYCSHGGRSQTAARVLATLGYTDIRIVRP